MQLGNISRSQPLQLIRQVPSCFLQHPKIKARLCEVSLMQEQMFGDSYVYVFSIPESVTKGGSSRVLQTQAMRCCSAQHCATSWSPGTCHMQLHRYLQPLMPSQLV